MAKLSPSQKIVMVFGTFDGLHQGHQFFLKQASALSQNLIIVIARDQNVKMIKEKKAHFSEKERAQIVQTFLPAARVVLGDLNDFYQPLKKHQPEIIALGYDQKADLAQIQKNLPQVKIIRLPAFHPEKYKSSLLNF